MVKKHLYLASDASNPPPEPQVEEGAAHKVWREVLSGFYKGHYQPGQRLKEVDLTSALGVSRSSVREALSRLSAEGIVTLTRHKGAIFRGANKKELLEILDVLEALLKVAAKLAVANMNSPENREAVEAELRALLSIDRNAQTFDIAQAQNRFFRTFLNIAGSAELRRVLATVHVHSLRMEINRRRSMSAIFADYMGILAALLAVDGDRAMLAVADHIDASRGTIRDIE